jgi:hypothetical protein
MGALIRAVLGAGAALAIAQAALAQSTASEASRIEKLHRASVLANESAQFFRQATEWLPGRTLADRRRKPPPPREDLEQYCDAMRDAIDLFLANASAVAIEQTQERTRSLSLKWAGHAPATLAAPMGCESQRGIGWLEHVAALAGVLQLMFHGTWETEAADLKFGPIAVDRAFYTGRESPANGLALLGAFKWLVDNNVLRRSDFYTPYAIGRVLGVDPFLTRTLYGATGFEHQSHAVQESVVRASRGSATCLYVSGVSATRAGAELFFECNYARPDMPTFEQVEGIFGTDWRIAPQAAGSAAAASRSKRMMYYKAKVADEEREGSIGFGPDGTVRSFGFAVLRR